MYKEKGVRQILLSLRQQMVITMMDEVLTDKSRRKEGKIKYSDDPSLKNFNPEEFLFEKVFVLHQTFPFQT